MNHKLRVAGLVLACFVLTGCLGRMRYSISHEVAAGYKLSRSDYTIASTVSDFPGREPGKIVGGHYHWNSFLFKKIGSNRAGIYFTEKFDPKKIPILFVHGLLSDPYTWDSLTTRLAADPTIKENYQFWYYAYPTSLPVISSSQVFRQHFNSCIEKLETSHGVSMNRRVILVGHSMGGVLAKTLISHSGDRLWKSTFRVPPDHLRLTHDQRIFLEDAYFFSPNPHVARAFFLGAPHRGSHKAETGIGKVGAKLGKVPGFMEDLLSQLCQPENLQQIHSDYREFLRQPVNSVASLRPSAPICRRLAQLPIDPDIPYHNIAAIIPGKKSDGIVELRNTSFSNVNNHITIHSGHNIHDSETVAVILSIVLKEHLGYYNHETAEKMIQRLDGLQWVDRIGY